jgi:hypothetical protein
MMTHDPGGKVRTLTFVNHRTGERGKSVDVSGMSEGMVTRALIGMLINIGDGWFVEDSDDA